MITLEKQVIKVLSISGPGTQFTHDDVSDLFSSSDPVCKIDSYTLKSENGSALEETAITLSNKTLSIDKTNPLVLDFDLQAKTVSGVTKSKNINVEVIGCGLETLTLAEPTNDVFNIYEKGSDAFPLKYSLKGIWTSTHPNDYIKSINGCQIINFKLCATLECTQELVSNVFAIVDDDLVVNVSVPITEMKVYLTPVTFGGIMDPKLVTIKICGMEIVTTVKVGEIKKFLEEPEPGIFTYEMDKLFENTDPLCPLGDFTLTSGGNPLPSIVGDKLGIKLEKKTLTIDKSKPLETKFYVEA